MSLRLNTYNTKQNSHKLASQDNFEHEIKTVWSCLEELCENAQKQNLQSAHKLIEKYAPGVSVKPDHSTNKRFIVSLISVGKKKTFICELRTLNPISSTSDFKTKLSSKHDLSL